MKNRRSFLKRFASITSGISFLGAASTSWARQVSHAMVELNQQSIDESLSDDDLWATIKLAYTVNPNLLNLNNGGVSPQPQVVQDAVNRYYSLSNEAPSYYMWRVLDKDRTAVKRKLAALAGVELDTIAINRNTTEALDTVIFGLDLNKGDEVVLSNFDYPNMMNAWKQREMRDGIKLNWVELNLPYEDEEQLVNAYLDQITSKTKVLHLTHLINWTGQEVPVKALCEAAATRGIFTLVDGAHSFAHLDFNVEELGCDCFGTSLHKWLCAPFGTGMLQIKKEQIGAIWPLFPADEPLSDNISKFENLGTRSLGPEMAIAHAIDFHLMIGAERKMKRLMFLKDYWCEQVESHPRIRINTPKNHLYGAIANFSIDGMKGQEINSRLHRDFRIHTVPIDWQHIDGVRVTPHVYTSTKELDYLADCILKIANQA